MTKLSKYFNLGSVGFFIVGVTCGFFFNEESIDPSAKISSYKYQEKPKNIQSNEVYSVDKPIDHEPYLEAKNTNDIVICSSEENKYIDDSERDKSNYGGQDEYSLLKVNWSQESPEKLSSIIDNSEDLATFYDALEVADRGFGFANHNEVKSVNMSFIRLYDKTNNEEIKKGIESYLSRREPEMFDEISPYFSLPLSGGVNDNIEKRKKKIEGKPLKTEIIDPLIH